MSLLRWDVQASVAVALVVGVLAPASAWGWSPPVIVSGPGERDTGPTVAVGRDGTAAVGWWQYVSPYEGAIGVRVRRPGAAWGPTQTVSAGTAGLNMDPSAAVDANGDALVVWSSQSHRILSSYAPAGQPFQPFREVAVDARGTGPQYPFVAFDAAGNALAIWFEQDGQLHYAARPAGGDFGASQSISLGESPGIEWPSYALGANGDAVATWTDGRDVWVARRRANGAFGAPQRVQVIGVPAGPPHAAVDPAGDVTLAWAEHVDTRTYMRAAAMAATSATFDASTTLAEVTWFDDQATVAMSSTGEATIAWTGESLVPDVYAGIVAVTRPRGGSFSAPALVTPAELGSDDRPAVAYDRAGTTYVLWQHYDSRDEDDTRARLLGEIRAAGGSFSGQPTTIAAQSFVTGQPVIAAGDTTALGAWSYGIGGFGPIEIADAGTATPSGAASAAPSHAVGSPRRTWCRVPKLRSLTRAGARRRLHKAHCRLGSVRYRRSSRRAGRVISQHPAAHSRRRAGSRVGIVLASRRRH